MSTQHTPAPWDVAVGQRVDGQEYFMVYDAHERRVPTTDDNAAFIVRACNSHDALVAALRPFANMDCESRETGFTACACRTCAARAALAAAEGK